MTETRGAYGVRLVSIEDVANCRCGRTIGYFIHCANGRDLLQVGPLLLSELHGVCVCGEPYHYCVTDRMLQKLVEHVKGAGNGDC